MRHSVEPMSHFENNPLSFSIRLLDRFYSIFLFVCVVLLTIGVPFVFYRKAVSAAIILVMTAAVLACWRMSRRGRPQKSLKLFASGFLLILVGLMFWGLPPITAATAMAVAVMLAVVIRLRTGVIFSAAFLLAWLLYIVLRANHLAPEPYFTGATLTGWIIGAASLWLVLLPTPELVRNLRKAMSLQRAVIEAATDGILVVNNDGNVETYNQRFMDFWHIPVAYLETHNDGELLGFVAEKLIDPKQFLETVRDFYAHPDRSGFDTLRFKDGRIFERHSQPQRLDGRVVGRVWSFRDVTERERAQAEIHRLAFHDALTMLPNRRLLNDRLAQLMAACKRSGQHGALMFLDLDNFKPLNDSYGHGVGDMLLVEVARRIGSCVRQVDTVARFGGDEFVVMLSELDNDLDAACLHAGQVAEKIRHVLLQPYHLIIPQDGGVDAEVWHHCTASIGIAMFSEQTTTADDIIKRADMAMYRAKDAGRNTVKFYEAESN